MKIKACPMTKQTSFFPVEENVATSPEEYKLEDKYVLHHRFSLCHKAFIYNFESASVYRQLNKNHIQRLLESYNGKTFKFRILLIVCSVRNIVSFRGLQQLPYE